MTKVTLIFKRKITKEMTEFLEDLLKDNEEAHITAVHSHSVELVTLNPNQQNTDYITVLARKFLLGIDVPNWLCPQGHIHVVLGESSHSSLRQSGIDQAKRLF